MTIALILEIVYTIMALIGFWFVIKKNRWGWFVLFLACFIMIWLLILKGLFITIIVFIGFALLDIKGFKDWKE